MLDSSTVLIRFAYRRIPLSLTKIQPVKTLTTMCTRKSILIHHQIQMDSVRKLEPFRKLNGKPFVSLMWLCIYHTKINVFNFPLQHCIWSTFSKRKTSAKKEREDIPRLRTKNHIHQIRGKNMFQIDITKHISIKAVFYIGLRYLHWIQTLYIVSCLPRFTNNLRSIIFCSSTSPDCWKSFRSSSKKIGKLLLYFALKVTYQFLVPWLKK